MAQRGTAADTTPNSSDRPVLAPATWLVGRLEESALEQPPWAVEQPQRGYVEMSELAYRVAEQATGDQTIEEIATAVSTALRRPVSAVDVEALIDTVLVPRGVVRAPNGYADDRAYAPAALDPRGRRATPAPASRRVPRERVVGPEPLEAIASVLMWLFWPPVMLVVAVAGLAALAWLIAIHGLARSVIQVFGVPILLPVTLLVAALGAAGQRIGPMVALYSGGATIQRLRILPSLRRPGFEVDLADDYGLSRWARLTVNVSGVYLQLVVALLLCVVGRLVGAECLFLAATLLVLNMLRLLLPFGRPGADRLLADWLLVQHPLRYAEQALDRFLPGFAASSRPLPPLKRRGHVTIGLYLTAVAVVLTLVGLVILRVVPTILATWWVALTAFLVGMAEALGERDVFGFVGALFDAAVLVLTTFCLVVALIVGVRETVVQARSWSRETPRRRLLALVGVAALVLLLAACWIPIRGFGVGGPPRSLVGIPYRSLTSLSRGTIFDLFGEPTPLSDAAADRPGDRPTVTTDVGSGVGGPLPDAATPSTGAGAGTGAAGSTNAAPTPGAPAAKPAPSGAETPGPADAGPGARGTVQPGGPPAAQATPGPNDQGGAGPASKPTSGPAAQPAAKPTAGTAGQPAPKPADGAADEPATNPTRGIVVQPVNKPTVGTAEQPAAKPATGAPGQPARKPSPQP